MKIFGVNTFITIIDNIFLMLSIIVIKLFTPKTSTVMLRHFSQQFATMVHVSKEKFMFTQRDMELAGVVLSSDGYEMQPKYEAIEKFLF